MTQQTEISVPMDAIERRYPLKLCVRAEGSEPVVFISGKFSSYRNLVGTEAADWWDKSLEPALPRESLIQRAMGRLGLT